MAAASTCAHRLFLVAWMYCLLAASYIPTSILMYLVQGFALQSGLLRHAVPALAHSVVLAVTAGVVWHGARWPGAHIVGVIWREAVALGGLGGFALGYACGRMAAEELKGGMLAAMRLHEHSASAAIAAGMAIVGYGMGVVMASLISDRLVARERCTQGSN